jgi:molybdopterin-guanine dinucleotide biosynthesis protein B
MAGPPRAIGFYGDSGSGKTTLVEALIAWFHGAGLRVAAVKHAHHGFDMDRPGKDSYRFRAAGAAQVLVASERRWALLSEEPAEPGDGALARLLARLDPCDLVLVEGYRGQAGIPFLRVWRRREDEASAVRPEPAGAIAVATDTGRAPPGLEGLPVLDLNNIEAIARYIAKELEVTLC